MDDGQVIPGLNENWTFAGAKPMEWLSGIAAAILFQEFFISNLGRSMPLILLTIVTVPIVLATLRKTYPDEERGLRNHIMSNLGLEPPGIPKPSLLQPVWSGAPLRRLPNDTVYIQLGLHHVLDESSTEEDEENQLRYLYR